MAPMSAIARTRLLSVISKNNRRFCRETASDPAREPIVSSASVLTDQPPPPPPPPPPPSAGAEKKPWNFLKYTLIAALTGGVAAAGYASYAYTLDEVDQKTKALHARANYTVEDDASALDKFQALIYSGAMTVPAKLAELYLDLRKLAEEQVRRDRGWRTFKRPGVDAFLEHLAQFYEIVVYSDQLNMYVDPVVDRLDPKHCIRYRLSRSATRYQDGKHYRDLSKLNRDPAKILYVSGHALESSLQPENSVPIKPWTLEADDTALLDLIPFLEYVAKHRPADIRPVLASYQGRDISKEFIEGSKEHQKRMQEQKQHGRFWRR
ncbi:mitochondrial import inner membrane translocase subunit TIM50 isoform X2 [Diospyros lotus]|uniref:mitochondrial import inner membrane translocase subunit TIM50 isoform X2 n=1 Tax=Diospyros lotus TaxID=55363 RepID=UPI00224E3E9C|nr:mitochondrial import inner membrane translocase subunit TIM50 isoform X2 [Diospyros lotus]